MLFPTIGLEIHAELLTNSKLFCGCKNNPNEKKANLNICPVCVGYPGVLPHINKKAIEHILKIGVAVNGKIAKFTEFDRKHYFYPDIPKGYQISQYEHPLISGGNLCGVEITRIHLEEDTAKSQHITTEDGSLIDFNRSGVPLMELVTEPVIKDAKEACFFAEELQLLIRSIGIANARMEHGEMRVEANISVSDKRLGGTKVEVKNLNSLKSVKGAIDYEIERQCKEIEAGNKVIQETRGWNENTGQTFSQRKKETSSEYRYFPEPDLTKFHINEIKDWDETHLRENLPETPSEKRKRMKENFKLKDEVIEQFIRNAELANLFENTVEVYDDSTTIANFLTSDSIPYILELKDKFYKNVTSVSLGKLVEMYSTKKISSRGAKDTLKILAYEGGEVEQILKEKNLYQQSDENVLGKTIDKVLDENQSVVKEYLSGKEKSIQFLLGQIMKETKGSANPEVAKKILKENIKKKG